MIDQLRQMAIFARVVDEGSFRAAAKDIGLSPSRVSETVSDLEHYLGVTLLNRTTRKIALTNEGRMFHSRVVEMLRSAEAGLNELNALSLEPVGALRISLPAFLSGGPLTSAIASFTKLHPNVAFSVVYSDNRLGLVDDGFDMNVRVGWLDDSSMMSRKLGDGQRVLVAGAGYAASRAAPQRPGDLEDWDWIRYKNRPDTTTLTSPKGKEESVTGHSQIEVDSIDALYHLAIQDVGVTILPSFLAERGEATGALVRLLPDWTLRPLGIYAVWPDKSRRESLTLLFVRYLAEQDIY
ncbi:LysR family transcriptional regulator (plasmid) [Rhizobium sp. SSM4.3]|uniref:LysR family transcriptional regulator n=2 Tax=Peteryoungia algae TaxID=2919917 RepID=A0ABT0CXP0_9HYPH|nr:LysR family transcriptional regulator [Rhizobium sp. SSM4.3]MCJ8237905.1 LysR family transcriptional regulator [Rhizobium sp. SSM4.3]